MKRVFRIFILAIIVLSIVFTAVSCAGREKPLRLHIRANGNGEEDQTVKLKVRDEVVAFLTPLLSEAKSVEEAKTIIEENSLRLEALCRATLEKNGFFYGAEVVVGEEYFPSRNYGDLTLESGVYEAVIINLGSGKGNNWWCVAYPPLCFGEEAEYRSRILDFINSRRGNDKN